MSANGNSTALQPSASLRKFTLETVELCFHLLVLNGGNVLRTQRLLREEGVVVSEGAIYGWTRTFFDRYLEIEHEFRCEIGPLMAARSTEIALNALEAQKRYIEEMMRKIEEVPARDLGRCARNLSQIMATNFKTAELFRDTQTTEPSVDDVDALEAELGSLPDEVIEDEATDQAADTPLGLTP